MADFRLVFCFVMFVVTVVQSRNIGRRTQSAVSSCRLLELPLERGLDLKRFEGQWYGMLKTGMGDSILSYFTEIYDTRIYFKLNAKGAFDIKAAGSKFYGGWCPKGKGHAALPTPDSPEKMTMYFDTRIGQKIGMKPAWVLKTDYTSYAILYSCWNELPDGTCDPENTYAGVIQRKKTPLNKRQRAEVDQALVDACVNPTKLTEIMHYGYCLDHSGL